tara:strand:- start:14979 stop:15284 length:306 start_codon:yes stop_codon:yes gene_type:complete
MKNTILKLPENTKGSFSEPKILGSLDAIGYRLTPVRGSYNKFWFTRKVEDGTSFEFMNGPKYYKLVIESREISIECGGDYNGWSFAADLRKEMRDYSKEAA